MALTWGDVSRWDPEPLNAAAADLNTRYTKLVAETEADVRKITAIEGWRGDAAAAAVAEGNALADVLESLAADFAALRRSCADTSDAIIGVKHGVAEAEALATAQRFTINADNSITDHGPSPDTPPDQLAGVSEDRKVTAVELAERVTQVLRTATDVNDDLCVVLDRILANETIDPTGNDNTHTSLAAAGNAGHAMGSLSIPPPPPDGATAAQNAAYWATLTDTQRTRLAHDHPHLVGPRDGFTAVHRNIANRELLGRERARLREAVTITNPDRELVKIKHLASNKAKLAELDTLEKMLAQPERQLMLLDTSGDRLKAAVGNGNVDTADHFAVYTPGMNTNVGNLAGDVNDMTQTRYYAEWLLDREEQQRNPGSAGSPATVATVTWLDYEPPSTSNVGEMLVDMIGGKEAGDSAPKLTSFYEGITESRRNDPHLTALGHSYGSLTTGIALNRPGTGVDDAVFFGSPGISEGPPTNPAEYANELRKLQIPEGHAYNLEADGDNLVADIPGFVSHYGNDPSSMPGMNQLSTHDATRFDGQHLAASTGHTEYTKVSPDGTPSTSSHNIAAIIAGLPHFAIADPR